MRITLCIPEQNRTMERYSPSNLRLTWRLPTGAYRSSVCPPGAAAEALYSGRSGPEPTSLRRGDDVPKPTSLRPITIGEIPVSLVAETEHEPTTRPRRWDPRAPDQKALPLSSSIILRRFCVILRLIRIKLRLVGGKGGRFGGRGTGERLRLKRDLVRRRDSRGDPQPEERK